MAEMDGGNACGHRHWGFQWKRAEAGDETCERRAALGGMWKRAEARIRGWWINVVLTAASVVSTSASY